MCREGQISRVNNNNHLITFYLLRTRGVRNSVEVHLGYNVDGNYDAVVCFSSVSLILKLGVDILCFTGEMVPAVHGME